MDQVKEYLGYVVKYRFWIVIVIASILPLVGYLAAAGSVAEEAAKSAAASKASFDAVKTFASNSSPVNKQYEPLVDQKTEILTSDVNASWRKLFDRQADLLTWPEEVADRFPVWGPKWPEGQDPIVITQALTDYVDTYENYYQNEVFQTVRPFDFETGEGIVNASTAQLLLRPPTFTVTQPPSLSEVWDTQRRFWVQHTVLDVLAKVNERANAKEWTTAPVKQILALDVANQIAQDQKSIAQGVVLQEAPAITDPNAPAETADPSAGAMGGAGAGMMTPDGPAGPGETMMPGMSGGMGMMPGMGAPGMGYGPMAGPQKFMILESPNPDQAFIVPLHLSVYIEQDRIPDLLVEFQNSPMNVEILDFAMHKPDPHSVKKPEKGQFQNGMMGMMGMMPGMDMMGAMMEGGYGGGMGMRGMADMMMGGMMPGMDPSMGMMPGMDPSMGMMPGMGGGMGGAASVPKKKGLDVRQENLRKLEEARKARSGETSKEEETPIRPTMQDDPRAPDPYYNVVRVEIYARARFYLPPPVEETPESESATLTETEGEPTEPLADPSAETTEPATAAEGTESPAATTDPAAAPTEPAASEAVEPPAVVEPAPAEPEEAGAPQ